MLCPRNGIESHIPYANLSPHLLMLTWLNRVWLAFLVVVLAVGGWLGYADWQQIRHQYGTNLLAMAAAVADGTHLFLNDAHNSMLMLGNEVDREGVNHPITTCEALEKYLTLERNFAAIGVRSWQGPRSPQAPIRACWMRYFLHPEGVCNLLSKSTRNNTVSSIIVGVLLDFVWGHRYKPRPCTHEKARG